MKNSKDANRVMEVLPKRFSRFGLTLHPAKSCVTVFKPQQGKPIDFLGFTHYWGRSRRGRWVIQRKTMKSRFARGLKEISQWCRVNRHRALSEQHAVLCRKLMGHYAYFGLRGNSDGIVRFRFWVERIWIKWLKRRSHRHSLDSGRSGKLLARYLLPQARLVDLVPANVMC